MGAEKKPAMSRVTPLEHTLIGGAAGVVEVTVMQPMMAMKNALQEGRPIPTNPRHLYRGLLINAASIAPITASQFGTNRVMEQAIQRYTGEKPSSIGRFGCAAVAGAASAFIGSPSEMIIIQQQKSGRTLLNEVQHFTRTYGMAAIFRGLVPCIARETVYAAGYLGLCPVLKDFLQQHQSMKDMPQGTPMLIAGIVGGVFGATMSQPADTVKTRMQAFMYSKPEYSTTLRSIQTIYKTEGLNAFFRGLVPRMTRIIGATFILNSMRTEMVTYLDNKREDDAPLPTPAAPTPSPAFAAGQV